MENRSHLNHGFQHEDDRPPPYVPTYYPGAYPTIPQYPTTQPTPINTHNTVTAGQPHPITASKAKKSRCLCITAAVIFVVVVLGVAAVLIWYFLSKTCALGQRCGEDGPCVSSSQWCDGKRDCLSGEDEAHCFRLYGPNFQLQSFSKQEQKWKLVCSHSWDNSVGRKACAAIGYSSTDYVGFGLMSPGSGSSGSYMILKSDYSNEAFSNSYLTESSYCPTNTAVTLKCTDCGKSTAQTRIVGGQQVTSKTRWPWQVSLHGSGRHLCGGSIIASSWIVSAAHCFQTLSQPAQWTVYAGYLTQTEMQFVSGSSVSRIISHPGFDPKTNNNDIALMKLAAPLRLSSSIGPVCLPNAGVSFSAPQDCFITGWGATSSPGSPSTALREARVSLIDRSICNSRQVYNGQITDTMICAGKLDGGVDSCQGDSGGPLVTQDSSLWWLVGDTSWGEGCALRNKPGVYGNVTVFLEWIYEQMQKY
ncbi:hypothetical protein AOLI_G00230910 [Acnodon oligacanthus]